jgi:WD40 repeat protein
MIDDDEIPEPKPLVEYGYLPEDEENREEPDILDKILVGDKTNKIPFEFGKNRNLINSEIKGKLLDYHRVKEPEKVYVPYDLDMEERGLIGPPIPKDFNFNKEDEVDIDSASIDEEENNEEKENSIPLSHLVEMTHTENKSLTSLDIDRSGNRLITGSYDGTVKIWDFNSMTRRPSAFHTVEAGIDYPVLSVSWSATGGFFVAATGDCQAKIFDRDGNFEIGCLKGDNYLHDINNTKGHTYPLTDAKWHPCAKNLFITAARDSTIRIWDIESKPMGIDQEIMQSVILKAKTYLNHKIPINCCTYSHSGDYILGGVNDGTIQLWTPKGNTKTPMVFRSDKNKNNVEITSVLFMENDDKFFFSRADDSTMKIWDRRITNKAVHTWQDIPCFSTKTGMCLSPDESIIVTGTCVKKGHENSALMFYSTQHPFEKIKEQKICRNSITAINWNSKLNQIAVGSNDGKCRMYFNPELSKNGIVNSIFKKAKTKEVDDFEYAKPIITPLVLPLFDETSFTRQTYLDIIKPDPVPVNKAELPTQGPGSKYARPPSNTQNIMTTIHKKLYEEGDARDLLLKFGDKNNSGEWVDSAYKKTAPKPVFDYNARLEDEVVYYESEKRKRCHGCGLKFCTCKKSIFQLPIPKLSSQNKKNF